MRILVLSDLYPPYYKGGHEIQCEFMVNSFREHGHEVFVLTCNQGAKDRMGEKQVFRKLYSTIPFSPKKKSRINGINLLIKEAILSRLNFFITKKMIIRIKPDIVYSGQLSGISVFPIKAIQKYSVPIIHHVGNYYLISLIKMCVSEKRFFRRILRQVIHGFSDIGALDFTHVVAVSNFVKSKYLQAGLPSEYVTVIPPMGISLEKIIEENRVCSMPTYPFKLLFVGRLIENKGLHVAILALSHLVNDRKIDNVKLDVIGEGCCSYTDEMIELASDLGLKSKINFRGKLSQDETFSEYSKYHVLVVPSVWEEPFGLVVIEGMACGVSVVASKIGGIVDIVENGKNGILVPPGDPVKLGEAVWGLIQDRSKFKGICIEGTRRVRGDFSNNRIVERILEYMEQLRKR